MEFIVCGVSFIVLFGIITLTFDELVKHFINLKKENKNLITIIDELKENSEELKKELNKLKNDTESFEKYVKEEIKEIFESIRFSNDEIVNLKDKFVKSSRAFEIQSLDLKLE